MNPRQFLTERFSHKPDQWRHKGIYDAIESKFQFLAAHLDEFCPSGNEKEQMFNRLEEALDWARKAIQRGE